MPAMELKNALQQIPGITYTGNPHADIQGIQYDSRHVRPGDLFVAIKGAKADGSQFIIQAIAKGAVAVALEQYAAPSNIPCITVKDARKFLAEISRAVYQDPCSKLKLAAITGTKGKTTTTYLINSIYTHAGIPSCLVGTIGMKINHQSYPSEHTTPESSDLLKFFHQAVEQGCTHGVLEVSSIALELKRVFGAKFTVGVFMNLTHEHLDFHKEMESYFQSKTILFTPDDGNNLETAVINTDDAYGQRLSQMLHLPVMTFGFNHAMDIRVLSWESRMNDSELVLATPLGEIVIHSQLIGRPNAYNMMAAVGAAIGLGFNRDQIVSGIEALHGVPGRMEQVKGGQDFQVIVDYAHTPDSLENLLHTLLQLPHRKLISVFGCGGDRDRTKRPVMGEIASRLSDCVIATSDNPRSEAPLAILKEIEPGLIRGKGNYTIEPDRRSAINTAITMAEKEDIVVIAGKGHEDYQLIGNQTLSFDDRKIAFELIQQRLYMDSQLNGKGLDNGPISS
jgi:UDP-N-acetylmuramoyl-L-alanyl-D-glutamate--2,6-diaminopimelate ligase